MSTEAIEKHCKVKMWNLSVNLERCVLRFNSTGEKEYVVHGQPFYQADKLINNPSVVTNLVN